MHLVIESIVILQVMKMTKIAVIWIAVCASVFIITRTQSTFTLTKQPSFCVPMVGVTYEFRTSSSTMCGMLCGEKRAVKYTFNSEYQILVQDVDMHMCVCVFVHTHTHTHTHTHN